MTPGISIGRFPQGCAQNSTWTRLLHERDDANVIGVGPRVQFDLKVLTEAAVLTQLADLLDLLNDGDVTEMFAGILSAENLRLGATEGHGHVDIGVVFIR